MEYRRLGNSGLKVSRICLGCMSFGIPGEGKHEWTLDEAASRPIIQQALEAGINFFDTANVYSAGTSEVILGRAIADFARREEVVVATKVTGRMHPGPNGEGLSRGAIMTQIDASLKRLGTDYVDLYQIHRWDPNTPIEETLEALHDVVKAGKARYIGASSMYAWQMATALATSDKHGWTSFISMQNLVNAIYREEEREMLPLCESRGIGIMAWSPLARGRLTRGVDETSQRSLSDEFGKRLASASLGSDHAIIEAVADIAARHGVTRAQVALAWVLAKPIVASPIVGATREQHLKDAVASLSVQLTPEDIAAIEAPYEPHAVAGFT